MAARPSKILIWAMVAIAALLGSYILGNLLLQGRDTSDPVQDEELDTGPSL